jgi:C1A family cysteine protease
VAIDEVHERVHARLKALPNVLNTFISTKIVKGRDTGTPCITVYVSEKVEERLLAPAELIPKEVEGIPTDVLELKPKTWKAGKTAVSQLSPAEQRRLLGLKPQPRKERPKTAQQARLYEVDWEAAGKTTPFKDQGNCGSCSSAGTLSALQDDLYVIRNEVCDLSIQDLFFGSSGTCEGGNTMEATLNYLRDKGVALTEDCPYQPELGDNSNKKEDWYLRGKRILSWSYCEDATLMKEALNQAPIITTMMVHQSFLNYVEGIYESQGVFDPVLGGHCVEVIGCSDSQQYWKGKNSWARWGMANSVFQIRYGDSEFDECMYIVVPNGPIPPPEPVPPICPISSRIWKIPKIGPKIVFLWRALKSSFRKLIF